jgi:uncharacterized protein (TIGR00251 family)
VIPLREGPDGVAFAVRVQPRARRNAIVGELEDALKIALTAPPVDGRANEACIEFFADLLNVPRASVTIASGQSSRNKIVRVIGLSVDELKNRLGETLSPGGRTRILSKRLQ